MTGTHSLLHSLNLSEWQDYRDTNHLMMKSMVTLTLHCLAFVLIRTIHNVHDTRDIKHCVLVNIIRCRDEILKLRTT